MTTDEMAEFEDWWRDYYTDQCESPFPYADHDDPRLAAELAFEAGIAYEQDRAKCPG